MTLTQACYSLCLLFDTIASCCLDYFLPYHQTKHTTFNVLCWLVINEEVKEEEEMSFVCFHTRHCVGLWICVQLHHF